LEINGADANSPCLDRNARSPASRKKQSSIDGSSGQIKLSLLGRCASVSVNGKSFLGRSSSALFWLSKSLDHERVRSLYLFLRGPTFLRVKVP